MSVPLNVKLHPILVDGSPRSTSGLKGGKQKHASERTQTRREPEGLRAGMIIAIISEPKVISETKSLLKSIIDSTRKPIPRSERVNTTAEATPVITTNKRSAISSLFTGQREMICPKISLLNGLQMGVIDSSSIQMPHHSPHPPNNNIYHSKLPRSKLSPRKNNATPIKSIAQYPLPTSGDRIFFDINTTATLTPKSVELLSLDTKPAVGISFSSVNYDLDRVLSVNEPTITTVTASGPRRFDNLILKTNPHNEPARNAHKISRRMDIQISHIGTDEQINHGNDSNGGSVVTKDEQDDTVAQDDLALQPVKPSSYVQFGNLLTEFEMAEKESFEQVYFTGLPLEQKIQRTTREDHNHGFDDDHDIYKALIGDHVGFRYEIIRPLGLGSFGDVYNCKDHKTGELVAVKIVKRRKRFSDQALKEIEMLKYLALHSVYGTSGTATTITSESATAPSLGTAARVVSTIPASSSSGRNGNNNTISDIVKPIIGLSASDSMDGSVAEMDIASGSSSNGSMYVDGEHSVNSSSSVIIEPLVLAPHADSSIARLLSHFEFRGHHCLVFPLHGMNLFEYLKKKEFVGLPVGVVKKIATQLLHCLVHLKNLKVIHSDLKPENILLKSESAAQISVVLVDFGSSCFEGHATHEYIQSRYYRSPEVIFGMPYGTEIDMWSFACLLPELRTAVPAFAGESELDQLAAIAEVLGQPPRSVYDRVPLSRRGELFKEDPAALSAQLRASEQAQHEHPLLHTPAQAETPFQPSENFSDSHISASQEEDNQTTMSELSSGTIEAAASVYQYSEPSQPNQSESVSIASADSNTTNNKNKYMMYDPEDNNYKILEYVNFAEKKKVEVELILRLSPLTGRVRAAGSRSLGSLINERAQDASFVSFLSMCLKWEPEVRLTPQQALQHPWLLPGDAKEGGGNEKKKKKGH